MNITLFLSIFSLLGVVYFILGLRASKRVTTDTDYYVAGRSLGIWQITCNLIATQLGGGMLLGTAAIAYTSGYYGIMYTLGMCIGLFLLAAGIASRLQQFKVTTTAQLFETQYNSSALKQIASLLSIITFFGILIAQVVGFKSLLAGVGLTTPWIVAIFWLSVVAYTMLGGLRAITINDMVQLGIITTVFGGIFIYALSQDPTSLFSCTSIVERQKLFSSTESPQALFATVLMPALFSLFQQDLAQRFFASRSKAVATMSALNAGIFLLIFSLIPIYFGMQAKILNLPVAPGANPLIAMLGSYTNDLIFSLVLCAIVAAIISTADALINAISANITQDFKIADRCAIKNRLGLSKIVTGIIGVSALIASYFVPQNIIGLIIDSYEISVSCLLVPLLFCYFRPQVKKEAAWGAIIAGFTGFILFRIYPLAVPKEILTLVLSLAGYWVGGLFKK